MITIIAMSAISGFVAGFLGTICGDIVVAAIRQVYRMRRYGVAQ